MYRDGKGTTEEIEDSSHFADAWKESIPFTRIDPPENKSNDFSYADYHQMVHAGSRAYSEITGGGSKAGRGSTVTTFAGEERSKIEGHRYDYDQDSLYPHLQSVRKKILMTL